MLILKFFLLHFNIGVDLFKLLTLLLLKSAVIPFLMDRHTDLENVVKQNHGRPHNDKQEEYLPDLQVGKL